MEEQYEIKLECVFCGSTEFEIPHEGYEPEEGEMIKCSNCDKLNDFISIRDVAVGNELEKIGEEYTKFAEDEILKTFKKAGFTIK
ncbi:MAG: hypothetical protein ACD_20C00357G0028 [uncultured bacterium]|nr:MAG: hypothetical protein ACD_20C00357G0028 [uncultured bacterium]HBH17897.1 hypothetical protein [Cyanobacteria bacterium UBA9579]